MKALVNSLFWYLLIQLTGLWVLQKRLSDRGRVLTRGLFGLTLLLAFVATPLAQRLLERSLTSPLVEMARPPEVIFVLGGGYVPGVIPEEDILVPESMRRVGRAATLWRGYPGARMVLSGAAPEYQAIRAADRHAQLMAKAARDLGVPERALLLEPRSWNTREHPIEALKLPGVTPATPISIVTSSWHMRRARMEFCRYFAHVYPYPVPEVTRRVGWQDVVPNAGRLGANTTLIHEWAGVLWYEILNRIYRPRAGELSCAA